MANCSMVYGKLLWQLARESAIFAGELSLKYEYTLNLEMFSNLFSISKQIKIYKS